MAHPRLHDHDPLRFVFLNACRSARADATDPFGGMAQGLVQQDVTAVVAFTPEAAVLAQAQFAGARREGTREDGRHLVALPSTDDDLLAGLLLQYGPDAEVVSPDALRDDVIVRLEKVRDA